MTPQICQIALCTTDMPRSVQLYSEVFGFAEAGGRALWGERIARIQDLGDDSAFVLWWLVGRQDLVQLEFFQHTTPPQRAVPDRAPNDLGWSRIGITVPDFDPVLERLAGLGIELMSEPLEHDGLRRACFRDPYAGVIVEVLEEGAATPGGIRPRFYNLVPALVYAAVTVPDLDVARRFFVDTFDLAEEPETVLHPPELEALWGLAGATRDGFVARGGDVYLEVVSYSDPPGQPYPDDHLLSDRGFMNIALGYRDPEPLAATYEKVVAGGYRDNFRAPKAAGGTYLNDHQGNTLEVLLADRELDHAFGFGHTRSSAGHRRGRSRRSGPPNPELEVTRWHVSLPPPTRR